MSILTVVICDSCFPSGFLTISEDFAYKPRGRYDGSRKNALSEGWKIKRDGSGYEKHLCPVCVQERGDG